jgi:hypothetical protein
VPQATGFLRSLPALPVPHYGHHYRYSRSLNTLLLLIMPKSGSSGLRSNGEFTPSTQRFFFFLRNIFQKKEKGLVFKNYYYFFFKSMSQNFS